MTAYHTELNVIVVKRLRCLTGSVYQLRTWTLFPVANPNVQVKLGPANVSHFSLALNDRCMPESICLPPFNLSNSSETNQV
jgi:hypothetical protein